MKVTKNKHFLVENDKSGLIDLQINLNLLVEAINFGKEDS